MNVRIESLGGIKVARIRHVGPYNEAGQCFERLLEWAGSVGIQPGRALILSYDDPDTVAPENLRSDACLELDTAATPPPGITVDTLVAGRYAMYTHRGSYDGIPEAFRHLFEFWLPRSGEEVDDRPCMEIFHNSPFDTRPEAAADRPVPSATRLSGHSHGE